MASLAEIRQQYPQYSDMSDTDLASALHRTMYSDMPRAEFDAKIGLAPSADASPALNFDRPVPEVRADIEKLPEPQRKSALKAWADQYVAKERAGGGVMQGVTDTVRNLARGTPVGSWLDEANAATASLMGTPREEALEYQRATDRAIDKGSTKIAGPVTVADLTKVAGGIASIPVSPIAQVFRGGAMLPQIGNAALSGAGYGLVYGAGQGEDTAERLTEAGKGAAIAGGLGAAAVPIARGVSNAAGYVADQFRRTPGVLPQFERGAVQRVARAVGDDDLAPRYAREAADLGPEGTLADMGQNLRGQAGAIANTPGPGQQRITEALHNRREGAAGRIATDVDNALGPAVNMPETIEATRRAYGQAARPHRDTFQNNPVPFTQELDDTLQTLARNEPAVVRDAARMAALDPAAGPQQFFARQLPDGTFEITRAPNATEWDYIKRALDGLAHGRSASPNDERIYGHWAARVRDQVDEAISPGAPQDSPWARARALEAENFQIRDAAEEGGQVFDRQLTPDQMRAAMFGVGTPPRGGMTPPEAAGYTLGAREQVRGIMGNASTAAGENAATAARSRLGSDYAREKLGLLADPADADQLIRRLDAETRFANTHQQVTQNSATARRQEAQREFPSPTASRDVANEVGRKGLDGVAMEGVYRVANALLGNALNERNVRIARDAAEMLIAQGASRDAIAQGLIQYGQTQALSQAQRRAIMNLAMNVMSGTRQKAVEAGRDE